MVILQKFVSLDGLAAGPNDSVDFVPAATRGDRSFGQEQRSRIHRVPSTPDFTTGSSMTLAAPTAR
jgi:hypothetical protein